ncbi:3-oxoacyl-[acyl-carrier-protein] reductase [Nautilia profundicola AmH]|uniref:3-oxoacyl-[acyl-carrier-protein] reductase n=1 Tax=Nautilia profundicola (strain ATCC BAA-1463 / DSM 18972 / AmH) TaxID=598659 RepID=B9L6J9_NAUPA|nr:glucose 1-dehydrogenase [Nautilia profundicola]ACM93331.1 3-oxoacyl-[acyl-carrier-protein] reductase [Nautilia profundicola AmH]
MLKGKTAVITGASSGIGLATARLFSKNGAFVILVSKNLEKLEKATEDIDRKALFDTDLSKYDEVKSLFSNIRKVTKNIDILVNNAGIIHSSMFMMTNDKTIKEVFEINTFSQMYMAQFASKIMLRQKNGSIINVSSIMGVEGAKGHVAYSASKSALIGFTKSLAKELAPFIRVNAVIPGVVDTPLLDNLDNDAKEKLSSQILLKRLATPDDIAKSILFLASDMSNYITSTVLEVDGGLCSIEI